ncbi:YjfB family protein [Fusibacter ferrireducens]|uniref:YjfB family protein n=1 Tax=Fusibacter ferrireducens TaxID=2785058 RepID=A0ABR9ZVK4_9FIRM|nr:YjfB family protein [Fusibacter ferrireducens]MBF4694496.1 YjfB family protein [Fusibacter ferrireducens]
MDIRLSSYQTQNLMSLRQALNISVLQKSMKQDAASVESVIKAMESSVAPHKGQNIDLKI